MKRMTQIRARAARMLILILAATLPLRAEVVLPQLFRDGMVVQRGQPIAVWGTAGAGETVVVTLARHTVHTVADADGHWCTHLPPMKSGGPYRLTVGQHVITDVLVGDVWLCSGQSNIDVTVERVYPWYAHEIDNYQNPNIRLFRVPNDTDIHGVREDIRPPAICWTPVNRQQAWAFSAIGYFLGRRMYEKTHVPQGIIVNSWGGTPIEAWISADALRHRFPGLVQTAQLYQDDNLVHAQQQADRLMAQHWSELLDASDLGILQGFAHPDYDDALWPSANQYTAEWAMHDGRAVIGSLWLRQHVHVDEHHAGLPARLYLGTLYDADVTYVNGRQVGSTGYQYPPRRYDIPAGLLHEGDNVIAIRFINKQGTAHFIKEKPYLIAFGDNRYSINPLPEDVIPLSPTWRYHLGAVLPPCPSSGLALQNLPTTLYNAVLHPLAPYGLAGVVWYQGESNTDNPLPYEQLLTTLITDWRRRWQQPQLPFVVVQLANFMEPSDQPQPTSQWARLREAQRRVADRLDGVELASAIDLGETVDIHPLRKKEVAERIGYCFDHLVYGDKKAPLMPRITDTRVAGRLITLTFDQPLLENDGLHEFEVAGDDGHFQNAAARAVGNTIVLSSPLATPVRVRHAWKDNPIRLNAYTASGLPVGPFEIQLDVSSCKEPK